MSPGSVKLPNPGRDQWAVRWILKPEFNGLAQQRKPPIHTPGAVAAHDEQLLTT